MKFAESANAQTNGAPDAGDAEADRSALRAAIGPLAVHEAAATVAIFNGLVRAADGTGIQLDLGVLKASHDFRSELGVDSFAGAANSASVALDELSPEWRDADPSKLFG